MVLCELEDVLRDAMKEHTEDSSMMGLRSNYKSGYHSSMRYGYRRGMRDYRDENRYAY